MHKTETAEWGTLPLRVINILCCHRTDVNQSSRCLHKSCPVMLTATPMLFLCQRRHRCPRWIACAVGVVHAQQLLLLARPQRRHDDPVPCGTLLSFSFCCRCCSREGRSQPNVWQAVRRATNTTSLAAPSPCRVQNQAPTCSSRSAARASLESAFASLQGDNWLFRL